MNEMPRFNEPAELDLVLNEKILTQAENAFLAKLKRSDYSPSIEDCIDFAIQTLKTAGVIPENADTIKLRQHLRELSQSEHRQKAA